MILVIPAAFELGFLLVGSGVMHGRRALQQSSSSGRSCHGTGLIAGVRHGHKPPPGPGSRGSMVAGDGTQPMVRRFSLYRGEYVFSAFPVWRWTGLVSSGLPCLSGDDAGFVEVLYSCFLIVLERD